MYIEISIGIALIAGILYYRFLYREAVLHHHATCVMHQKMLLNIMSEQIGAYFQDTQATNHVVRMSKNGKVEILIGDNDFLVPVDMEEVNVDSRVALNNAYNRFVER